MAAPGWVGYFSQRKDWRMLKIAVVHWPLNDVGGIDSWCKNFVVALGRLGIPNRTYYATPQGRYGCSPDVELVKARHVLLRATHLSYRRDLLAGSLRELNGYDLIVMIHPSPHPTRKVMASKDPRGWMELYRGTRPPKLVIFHDANWRKTNPWFAEVADHVDAAAAAQRLFVASVEDYPAACPKRWDYFPLDLSVGARLRSRVRGRRGVIVCTQWLKWKNHHRLLPHLPRVLPPVSLYGAGQEYYTLKKSGVFQTVVGTDHVTGEVYDPSGRHHYHGFVPYERVLGAMSRSVASLDLSTKGYTNMTHWEPLAVGTLSLIERRVAEHPDNQIPADCCVPYDLDSVADDVNRVVSSPRMPVVRAADSFIKDSDCVAVTRRMLRWLSEEGVIGENPA
jgi:hypothetical protein